MSITLLLVVFLAGAVVAALTADGRWKWYVFVAMALLLAVGVGAPLLVEKLSPAQFSSLPVKGGTLASFGTWLSFFAAGGLLGALVRIVSSLFRKKSEPEPAPSAE